MVSSLLGAMRVRVFMPDESETTAEKRGFTVTGAEQRERLERVGSTFLAGLRVGLDGTAIPDIEHQLDTIDRQFRGFAYEGCAMGLAVSDAVSLRPRRVQEFLAGPATEHVYMVYIGVGWALARLPRLRWRAVTPDDRLLRWLALDGLGFHQAYFDTKRYVTDKWRPAGYPAWPGQDEYAHRAVDQGIGRALWFLNGADPLAVAGCIETFPISRRADLWSGAGLASVYAGGVDAGALATFFEAAGRYQPEVAQGAAFAAKTRLRTGLVMPHTELAVKTHCEMSIEDAAAITDQALVDLPPDGPLPAYEVWRQRIQNHFR
jgi:hypothetical protein